MLTFDFSVFPVLQTGRLLLRRMEPSDLEAVYFLRSNEEVMRYIDKERATSMGEAQALMDRLCGSIDNNEAITWAMALKEAPGQLIGHIGLWRVDKAHHRAEIGYTLHPGHWNKGLMKEALQEVIRYGFEDMRLHSIEAHINPGNAASEKILENAGFVAEAYFRESHLFNGQFLDTKVFSLLTPIK